MSMDMDQKYDMHQNKYVAIPQKSQSKPQAMKADKIEDTTQNQGKEHFIVIEAWTRKAALFQKRAMAEILIQLITMYSVPIFRFHYGNEQKISLSDDGMTAIQLTRQKCSFLFGPRIKPNGDDKNMIYSFNFHCIGNMAFGLVANMLSYSAYNEALNDAVQRHAVIWRNGFYHFKGTQKGADHVKQGHVEDIWREKDIVQFKLDLVNTKCTVLNLSKANSRPFELPFERFINYELATGYIQIVISFFNDYGENDWVKSPAQVQAIAHRGEYYTH